MKVKVVNCKDNLLWYKKHIGEIFEVVRQDSEYYWCLEKNLAWRCLNIINKADCVIIDELKE